MQRLQRFFLSGVPTTIALVAVLAVPVAVRAAQPTTMSITADKLTYHRDESIHATIHLTPIDVDTTLLIEASMPAVTPGQWRIDIPAGTSELTPTLALDGGPIYWMTRDGVYDLTVRFAYGLDGWEPSVGGTVFQLLSDRVSIAASLPTTAVPDLPFDLDITLSRGSQPWHDRLDVWIDGYAFDHDGADIDGHGTYQVGPSWSDFLRSKHLPVDGGHILGLEASGAIRAYFFFWVGKNPPAVGPVRINGGSAWTRSLQVAVLMPGRAAPGPVRLSNVGRVGADGSFKSGRTLPFKAKLPWRMITKPGGPTWPATVYAQWKQGAKWSAGGVDWIGYDWTAPTIATAPAIRVLGPAATAGKLQVAAVWKATDRFGELKSTDIQVSLNNGAWKTLPDALAPISFRALTVSSGTTVKVRIRVADAAGNRTGWIVSPAVKAVLPAI